VDDIHLRCALVESATLLFSAGVFSDAYLPVFHAMFAQATALRVKESKTNLPGVLSRCVVFCLFVSQWLFMNVLSNDYKI
jgi:hypothetical protein